MLERAEPYLVFSKPQEGPRCSISCSFFFGYVQLAHLSGFFFPVWE